MVRAPNRSCPNLARLFDDAETDKVAGFLASKPFAKLEWLKGYAIDPQAADPLAAARRMLVGEKMHRLGPLETEAARIVTIAGARGQFALDGMAREKLDAERMRTLCSQKDELDRSLWTYSNEHALFEAVESTLHLRLYRRYDRHYQTFVALPSPDGGPATGSEALGRLLAELERQFDRGQGYTIDRFDIPEEADEPAAEMYLLYHPGLPTSVREIDDQGNRSPIYFRPPGEAMVVFTPSTGRVHVRAGARRLRHIIARQFIETALLQAYSEQPEDFQAYDLSRFFNDLALTSPIHDDVVILRARVIRLEVSVGNLGNRLSLSTAIDQDMAAVIVGQPGLDRTFARAIAIRFVEIAVRYRRAGGDTEKTLDFTLTDRNTSSLFSLDDPFERVLGHRLLRNWNILRDGRAPTPAESLSAVPVLLALWDTRAERVSGAWLRSRHAETTLLIELGFLVPDGWEGDDVIDDEESVGQVAAMVVVDIASANLQAVEGQVAPGGPLEDYRIYRVRDGWVAQHLRQHLAGCLDMIAVETVTPNLIALGTLGIDGRDVPVWLARGLHEEHVRDRIDTELRARANLGIGLVLQAGDMFGKCLGANVLTPALDHVVQGAATLTLISENLRTVYRRNRSLAEGGQTVHLDRTGDIAGTLFVPGKGSIDIVGEHRLLVIQRLVDAHNSGPVPMKTADLIKGIEGQSLANIFKQPLWGKLKATFLRSLGAKGPWEIAI